MVSEMTMTLVLCSARGTSPLVTYLVTTRGFRGKGEKGEEEPANLGGVETQKIKEHKE